MPSPATRREGPIRFQGISRDPPSVSRCGGTKGVRRRTAFAAAVHGYGRPDLEGRRGGDHEVAGRRPRPPAHHGPRAARRGPPPLQVRAGPLDRPGTFWGGSPEAPCDLSQLRHEGRTRPRGRAPPEGVGAQRIAYPPSTTSVTPVMKDASSEHRNTAFLAISSGDPRRFKAASSARDRISASESPAIASVSTAPGAIAFTWTL